MEVCKKCNPFYYRALQMYQRWCTISLTSKHRFFFWGAPQVTTNVVFQQFNSWTLGALSLRPSLPRGTQRRDARLLQWISNVEHSFQGANFHCAGDILGAIFWVSENHVEPFSRCRRPLCSYFHGGGDSLMLFSRCLRLHWSYLTVPGTPLEDFHGAGEFFIVPETLLWLIFLVTPLKPFSLWRSLLNSNFHGVRDFFRAIFTVWETS